MKLTQLFKNQHELKLALEEIGFEPFRVVQFYEEPLVLDLSSGMTEWGTNRPKFTIGKYNEKREGVYQGDQFEGIRKIHIGIDIGAPVGTHCFSPLSGKVFCVTNNDLPFDYGPTLITEHAISEKFFWILWGHLSWDSIKNYNAGDEILAGQKICEIGNEKENGGWPSHLHFQISLRQPEKCDLPGAVSSKDLIEAMEIYPDPRIILGTLY